jgi:CBS domain-containing membrane protein
MRKPTGTRLIREDFVKALNELDTYIDITVEDLMDLNARAEKYARIRVTESLLVANLMSQPVVTVRPEVSLSEAAHLLVTNKISGLPVVDDQQKLVGVVTEADFLRALGVSGQRPSHSLWQTLEAMFSHHETIMEPDASVAEIMVTDVVTVGPQHTVHHILDAMKANKIRRIIVCDEAQQVLGIVTRSDLVRVFFDRIKRAPAQTD